MFCITLDELYMVLDLDKDIHAYIFMMPRSIIIFSKFEGCSFIEAKLNSAA